MIYLKNNTETQSVYIPRQTVLGGGYIPSTKAYDKGYNDGLEVGKEQQKGKLSNLNVTANGQYEREDGWNVVTVDVPTKECNLGEGNFSYTTSDVGRYELNASDDGYEGWSKIYLEIEGEGAIRVWRASELLDSFNNGETLDYGRNYYVGGQITEIQEISTRFGDATYILDNGFQIFRGKWIDGNSFTDENQIKVGAYIVVYGVLKNYNGQLELDRKSQVIAYQECTGGEIISCNLEDKSVTPSMSDRDSNNLIVVEESEGYDGLSRVVIDPQTIYNEGVNEQKSKLETISITENGTYNKEDGYNHIEVNVPSYEQGQADLAAKARILEVTKNGVYRSKYSDPILPTVTGVYADGTEFYNYAELSGRVYNTKIEGSIDSRLEFWYKGGNPSSSGDAFIIGSGNANDRQYFQVIYNKPNSRIYVDIGRSRRTVNNWDNTVWHHFIVSKAEGLWIDGEKKGDFTPSNTTINGEFYINGIDYNIARNANGCYGMIKIDDVVIIPTANGFLNTNMREFLDLVKKGSYTFTRSLPTYGEGELYKTINVNVPDLNGSYNEGYTQGKTDGVNEQKSKLETINITANGTYSKEDGYNHIEVNVPTVQEQSFGYDITAFTYKVYDWTSVNINRNNMTNDCGDRPLDCLLFRNRSGECTVMTKFDTCSGTARLENGWSGDSIILSLKSNTITKFSSNSINSNQLTSIDTGFAKLEGNAIMNCNALTDIKVTVLNDNLSTQFATNCFNGLPAEGTITIGKNVDVTITDDEITSFFRTIVGEGWTITIK